MFKREEASGRGAVLFRKKKIKLPDLSVLFQSYVFPLPSCPSAVISLYLQLVFQQAHPCVSVCFMYAREQHHDVSAAQVLVCLMLCSRFKQFRISVTHTRYRRGHTLVWDVSFSGLSLQRVCILVPGACQRNRSLPTRSQILAYSSTLESRLARKCSTNPIGCSFSKSFSNWTICTSGCQGSSKHNRELGRVPVVLWCRRV